jgi:hypothetical protein
MSLLILIPPPFPMIPRLALCLFFAQSVSALRSPQSRQNRNCLKGCGWYIDHALSEVVFRWKGKMSPMKREAPSSNYDAIQ